MLWVLLVANPLPPTPFRKSLLFHQPNAELEPAEPFFSKSQSRNWNRTFLLNCAEIKNLMPLFSMGCFPADSQEGNGPLRHFGKRPFKDAKRPIKEGKRPISANGQHSGTLPWWKTAPLKRPNKRSMKYRAKPTEPESKIGTHSIRSMQES